MAREVASLDALASNLKHQISHARDIISNDRYYNERSTYLTTTIAELQRQLDELNDMREHGADRIDAWKAQLLEVNAERKLLVNSGDIEKLLKLQEKLNATV